jgi:hypothetical protein
MSTNYPPGVTGTEPQIAGADSERETIMWCEDCGDRVPGVIYWTGPFGVFACDPADHETDIDDEDRIVTGPYSAPECVVEPEGTPGITQARCAECGILGDDPTESVVRRMANEHRNDHTMGRVW